MTSAGGGVDGDTHALYAGRSQGRPETCLWPEIVAHDERTMGAGSTPARQQPATLQRDRECGATPAEWSDSRERPA